MSSKPTETSEDVRKFGNKQHQAGKFAAAVPLYKRAAKLAPTDPAPLSNLSAPLYELADYEGCDAACNSALALLEDASQDAASKQKLYIRQVKARLNRMQVGEAEEAARLIIEGQQKSGFLHTIEYLKSIQKEVKEPKELHTRLILELPRYKPMVCVVDI